MASFYGRKYGRNTTGHTAAEQDRPRSAADKLAKLSEADLCKHRVVLINMKVIPIFAGLWAEGTV
jgi:hypothetical protein